MTSVSHRSHVLPPRADMQDKFPDQASKRTECMTEDEAKAGMGLEPKDTPGYVPQHHWTGE
eukprot:scaffold132107_cov15-Tisochrysis_lutea.AAC.1